MPGNTGGIRRMGQVSPAGEGLSYNSYLRVKDLLDQQRMLSQPEAHDELLFIVVHQAYELWFKQLLFELETIRDAMRGGDVERARHLLVRVHAVQRVLIEQVPVLESMSPLDFMVFRANLSPASGFQSVQFREIEFLSGIKNPALLAHVGESDEERARLVSRLNETTVWEGFTTLVESRGVPMPPDDPVVRMQSLVTIARDPAHVDLNSLAEALLTYDELFAQWRHHHILMVERQIGSKSGTGGSSGASYLRTTLERRFFPELWELRSHL
jgi:tryptophan 2,3-dioxygenase